MSEKNVLQKYLDDVGTFQPTYDEIHSDDLFPTPKDRDLYRLTDIEGINDVRSEYSVRQKLQAVTLYVLTGNLAKSAEKAGVKRETAKYWKTHTSWWPEAVARIKLQRNEKLDADMTRCMDLAIAQVEDRIVNGDEVVLKDGSKTRKKLGGKDMAVMYSILHDKRAIMRGDTSAAKSERNTQNEILQQLKSSFEDLSQEIKRERNTKIVSNQ